MTAPSSTVAPAITESLEITAALNIGSSAAYALAQNYVGTSHALNLQALTQQHAQQEAAIATQAVATAACSQILATGAAELPHDS